MLELALYALVLTPVAIGLGYLLGYAIELAFNEDFEEYE